MLSVPAQREGLSVEPQTRLPDLSNAGVELTHQIEKTYRTREAAAIGGAAADQPVVVNGLHAQSAL